jgi:hypothetical protein
MSVAEFSRSQRSPRRYCSAMGCREVVAGVAQPRLVSVQMILNTLYPLRRVRQSSIGGVMQVAELDTPAFVVDLDVLERNVRSMAEHARRDGMRTTRSRMMR